MPDSGRCIGYWVGYDIRKAFTDALFLGSKKLPLSEDIVKSEAIVDARWVSICTLFSPNQPVVGSVGEVFAYTYFAGCFYHCSFYYIGLW